MRMRFGIFSFLFFLFVFSFSAWGQEPVNRALFVSVIQDPQVLLSRAQIDKLVEFAKKAQIKVLFVQIYRSNQSWFPSALADSRPYDNSLRNTLEDPFALLIAQAHRQGIQVHAWLNVLSLGANAQANFLVKYGPEILTRNRENKKTIRDYLIDGQYFLEPGDTRVREDLEQIVGEIVKTYPELDGIQFDYIRYPDVHPRYGYTKMNMDRFKKASGSERIVENSLLWEDWKRAQVTELLTLLVQKARGLHPGIQVSSTGCMPYSRAYYEAFQDWPYWLNSGLVDFVTVMNYSSDPEEFLRWNKVLKSKVADFKKVKIGVGAYKLKRSPEIFAQEFRACETYGVTCAIFHYGSLVENPQMANFLLKEGR